MIITPVELLTQAREDYCEHGFAKGCFDDQKGNRCALGSMNFVVKKLQLHASFSIGESFALQRRAHQALNKSSKDVYGKLIEKVNDEIGREAVLHCYDLAIKECEENNK